MDKLLEIKKRLQKIKNKESFTQVNSSHLLDKLTDDELTAIRRIIPVINDYYIEPISEIDRNIRIISDDYIYIVHFNGPIPNIINNIKNDTILLINGVMKPHGKINSELDYCKPDVVYYKSFKQILPNIILDNELDEQFSKNYNSIVHDTNTTYQVFVKVNNNIDLGIMAAYDSNKGSISAVVTSEYCPSALNNFSLPKKSYNDKTTESSFIMNNSLICWYDWKIRYNRHHDHGLILYDIIWKEKLRFVRLGLSLYDCLCYPLDPQFIWANRITYPLSFFEGLALNKTIWEKGINIEEKNGKLVLKYKLYHPLCDITYVVYYIFFPSGKLDMKIHIDGMPETRLQKSEGEYFGIPNNGIVIPYVQYTMAWRIILPNISSINKCTASRLKINTKNPYGNAAIWAKEEIENFSTYTKKNNEYWEISNIDYIIKPITTANDITNKIPKDIIINKDNLIIKAHYITDSTVKYGLDDTVMKISLFPI